MIKKRKMMKTGIFSRKGLGKITTVGLILCFLLCANTLWADGFGDWLAAYQSAHNGQMPVDPSGEYNAHQARINVGYNSWEEWNQDVNAVARDGSSTKLNIYYNSLKTVAVVMPESQAKSSEISAISPNNLYTVQPGDTLWGIAARFLKDGLRWKEIYIYRDNQKIIGNNHNNLVVGQKIMLPDSVGFDKSTPESLGTSIPPSSPGIPIPLTSGKPASLVMSTPSEDERIRSSSRGGSQKEPVMPIIPIEIGYSVKSRSITAYKFGDGPLNVLLVGAIHGGFESNTAELMQQVKEYFSKHPEEIDHRVTLWIIPAANPDGLANGTRATNGNIRSNRYNANGVDLNGNWGTYDWVSEALDNGVGIRTSNGPKPFSEPEVSALRDFILAHNIKAVVFYHSQEGAVYTGRDTRTGRIDPASAELANRIIQDSGYRYGSIGSKRGEAINWAAENGIPAALVELTDAQNPEIARNLRGVRAVMQWVIERNK